MVAVLLTTVAVGALLLTWNFSKTRMDETTGMRSIENQAFTLSDVLVKTRGTPTDWESRPSVNITSIGLAGKDRELSPSKMEALDNIDKSRLRDIFMLDKNTFYIVLRRLDGSVFKSIGDLPQGDSAVKSTRVVTYQNQTAILEVTIGGSISEGCYHG